MNRFVISIALVVVGLAAATLAVVYFKPAQIAAQRAVIPGKLSQLSSDSARCRCGVSGGASLCLSHAMSAARDGSLATGEVLICFRPRCARAA